VSGLPRAKPNSTVGTTRAVVRLVPATSPSRIRCSTIRPSSHTPYREGKNTVLWLPEYSQIACLIVCAIVFIIPIWFFYRAICAFDTYIKIRLFINLLIYYCTWRLYVNQDFPSRRKQHCVRWDPVDFAAVSCYYRTSKK